MTQRTLTSRAVRWVNRRISVRLILRPNSLYYLVLLFKYRSCREFNYFVDMILHSRLYAAPYFCLNDPLEGHYTYDGNIKNKDKVKLLKGEKDSLRICSLSKTSEDALMWAHYADGSRGMVIGVSISEGHEAKPISYIPEIPTLDLNAYPDPKDVLIKKLEAWAYEKEYRVFTKETHVAVEVKKIILGVKMPKEDKSLIKELVKRLSKNIPVEQADAHGRTHQTIQIR